MMEYDAMMEKKIVDKSLRSS